MLKLISNTACSTVLFTILACQQGCAVDPSQESSLSLDETAETGTKVGLTLVGIDENVARRAGFEVVRDPNGKLLGVRKPGEIGVFKEYDVKPGNCGWSDVRLHAVGGAEVHLDTAFGLNEWGIARYWQVDILDNAGSSAQIWNDAWDGYNFDGWRNLHLAYGTAYGRVYPSNTWAMLWWGGICSSLGLAVDTWVY
jgi:hypothetical protein